MKTQTIVQPATVSAQPRIALPARIADCGRVRFGAGVGIMPRLRG